MKKLLLAVALLSNILTVSAIGSNKAEIRKRDQLPERVKTAKMELKNDNFKVKVQSNQTSLSTRADISQDIIYNVSGEEKQYMKDAAGLAVFYGELIDFYDQGAPATIVWGDNDEVYFYNILSALATDTYTEGHIAGNEITVEMGQCVMWVDDDSYYDPYGVLLGVLKANYYYDEEEEETYVFYEPDFSIDKVTYTLKEDGSLELNLPGDPFDFENLPEYVLGFYYSDTMTAVGPVDFYQIFNPLGEDNVVIVPDSLQTESYVYIDPYFHQGHIVEVGKDGDYLYIIGLSEDVPEGAVRATLDGNIATIPQNEIIGMYLDVVYIYTKCVVENPDYDPYDWESEECLLLPDDVVYKLIIDEETKTISSYDNDCYFCLNMYENMYYALEVYDDLVLNYGSYGVGQPQEALRLAYITSLAPMIGYNYLGFIIPNVTVDNVLLREENIYYRIFIDGLPFTFENQEGMDLAGQMVEMYPGVEKPTQLLEYNFTNEWDIESLGGTVIVGFYMEGISTLGVQIVYKDNNDPDSKEYAGRIVVLNVETGEIEDGVEILQDEEIEQVSYFNMNGLPVNNPSAGLYIMKVKFKDGTVKSFKINKTL